MTEKRYGFVDLGETWCISVDGECKYYMHRVEDCKEVVELLNENEHLKKELNSFKPIYFNSEDGCVTLYEKKVIDDVIKNG